MPASAVVAAAALLCRQADGRSVLPFWLEAVLQVPALLAWCHWRCRWFGVVRAPDSADSNAAETWLTLIAIAGAAGLALSFRLPSIFLAATSTFIIGMLLVNALTQLYARADEQTTHPVHLLRTLIRPWLMLIVVATILLSLPLATNSAVPDYRHNFWDHILNNAFAAASAAGLVGPTIYGFGSEYTLFGQTVLVATVQLAGMGFAAVGLAIFRPFLWNPVRLRTILRAIVVLQVVGIAVVWTAWRPADTPTIWDRFWWSLVHVGSALSNCGLVMRSDGLAGYIWNPAVFATITTLSIIGSLGLPVILDLILGQRAAYAKPRPKRGEAPPPPLKPWHTLPHWEAAIAFILLLTAAFVLWGCETPWQHDIVWRLPDSWIPARPVDLGTSQLSLRDDMPLPRRWTLAVFVSATLRSAGMQSIPVVEGVLSWPSYGLLLAWMFIGGSAAGVAGGLRTTALLLPLLCLFTRRARWSAHAGGETGRRLLLRAGLGFIPLWLAVNVAFVGLLATVSAGTPYERFFEATAACNSVGLSTGLSLHLTGLGRVVMILTMLVGRFAPVAYWLRVSRRFDECLGSARRS